MRFEFVHPNDCGCYECVGEEYHIDKQGNRHLENNMKHHTFGEPCPKCGREKTEYRDLGTKGYYICWWCTERAAGTQSLDRLS